MKKTYIRAVLMAIVALASVTICGCTKEIKNLETDITVYGTVFHSDTYEPVQGAAVSIQQTVTGSRLTSGIHHSTEDVVVGNAYTGSDGSYEIRFTQLDREYWNNGRDYEEFEYEYEVIVEKGDQRNTKVINLRGGSNRFDVVL